MEREIERPDDLYKCVICGAKFDSQKNWSSMRASARINNQLPSGSLELYFPRQDYCRAGDIENSTDLNVSAKTHSV